MASEAGGIEGGLAVWRLTARGAGADGELARGQGRRRVCGPGKLPSPRWFRHETCWVESVLMAVWRVIMALQASLGSQGGRPLWEVWE